MRRVFYLATSLLGVTSLKYKSGISYSTQCNGKNCVLVEGDSESSHASGTFVDDVDLDGWGKLWVHGDNTTSGWYESGFIEGSLTSTRIYQHYKSWYSYTFGTTSPTQETLDFISEQYDYSWDLVAKYPTDSYYIRLGQVLHQFEGILGGLNYAAEEGESLTKSELLLLEAAGDLYDIIPATNPSKFELHIGKLSQHDFFEAWHKTVSCSALIKMSDDKSDIFAAHTTWTSFQNMLRIYKNYDLDGGNYQSSHSSKPGVIYSKDDFYTLPKQGQLLVVMETTNGVLNDKLYDLVTPKSLLTWQRIPIANSFCNTGKDWVSVFAKHNSGTYANQWMVLDMKLFTPNVGPASKDFLWIIEVAPGVAISSDVSSVFISNGNYWPSVNVPYQPVVHAVTGFTKAQETYGDQYSYENCTRFKMFQRDHVRVQSFDDMKLAIRYNQYQTDELAGGDPYNSICSRKDLRTSSASTSGGVDGKVTSYSRMMKLTNEPLVAAINGPTHDDQPVFQWSGSKWESQVHLGQPDVFDFEYVNIDFYGH